MSDYKTDYDSHQQARKEKMETVVDDFSNVMNSFNRDGDVFFIDAFCRKHRTTQQSMFGVITKLVGHMASDKYYTDPRNEQSKRYAQAFLNGLREMYAEQERDYWQKAGYSPDDVEVKVGKFYALFDKDPSVYLNLGCV